MQPVQRSVRRELPYHHHNTASQRLLGGHLGSEEGKHSYVHKKVTAWAAGVRKLAEVAKVAPQQAYIGLTKCHAERVAVRSAGRQGLR